MKKERESFAALQVSTSQARRTVNLTGAMIGCVRPAVFLRCWVSSGGMYHTVNLICNDVARRVVLSAGHDSRVQSTQGFS